MPPAPPLGARNVRLAVVRQVRQTYNSIAQATSALDAVDAYERMLVEIDRTVMARIGQRVALKAEGLDVQAKLAENAASRLKWQHAVSAGKEQLNRLMGRAIDTQFDIVRAFDAAAALSPVDVEDTVADLPDVQTTASRARRLLWPCAWPRPIACPMSVCWFRRSHR
jgi:outer membrane protein TolC